jgi:hypothetical protein
MSGAIPSLPSMPSWHGQDNLTFYFHEWTPFPPNSISTPITQIIIFVILPTNVTPPHPLHV